MKKIINRCIRSLLVIALIIVTSVNTSTYEANIENENINKTVNLMTMAMKIANSEEERLYTPLATYTGDLTGYAYNCAACLGTLACNWDLDLSTGRTTYEDEEYGEVKIVATSRDLPCGSILRFNSERVSDEPVIAIALDKGVLGTAVDLLVVSEDFAAEYIGRSVIEYDVLRLGY